MPRLRRVSRQPGWTRRRTGRGFHYVGDPCRAALGPAVLDLLAENRITYV